MIGSNPNHNRGFALFIAIVLAAIAALITVSVTTIAYKSLLLSSDAQNSQYAFYAADSALECALYWDSGQRAGAPLFPYVNLNQNPPPPLSGIKCPIGSGGTPLVFTPSMYNGGNATTSYVSQWFDLQGGGTGCVRVSVYKDKNGHGSLFADATNVSCSSSTTNPRALERGLHAVY